jgi:glutamyl endopeptidase
MSSSPFPRQFPDIASTHPKMSSEGAVQGDISVQGEVQSRDVILPSDDRERVQNTTLYPARVIAQLILVLRDGSERGATGTFIGPRTLLTAAHPLYRFDDDPVKAGRVDHVVVIPGRDAGNYPFGFGKSSSFYIPDEWINHRSAAHDYALVFIDSRQGDDDVMKPVVLDDTQLRGLHVYLSGYPTDKSVGTQWHHDGPIRDVSSSQLLYDIDTEDGQSGSAVFAFNEGTAYVVGVHRFGEPTGNLGTRVTPDVLNDIRTRII